MADTARIAEALALVRDGRGFEAHEEFEELWRAAVPAERDLYQGLVHVAVATYQDSRGNEVGRTRQLEKALRRLTPYAPVYEGVEIAARPPAEDVVRRDRAVACLRVLHNPGAFQTASHRCRSGSMGSSPPSRSRTDSSSSVSRACSPVGANG